VAAAAAAAESDVNHCVGGWSPAAGMEARGLVPELSPGTAAGLAQLLAPAGAGGKPSNCCPAGSALNNGKKAPGLAQLLAPAGVGGKPRPCCRVAAAPNHCSAALTPCMNAACFSFSRAAAPGPGVPAGAVFAATSGAAACVLPPAALLPTEVPTWLAACPGGGAGAQEGGAPALLCF
jgi:hypothetical protein